MPRHALLEFVTPQDSEIALPAPHSRTFATIKKENKAGPPPPPERALLQTNRCPLVSLQSCVPFCPQNFIFSRSKSSQLDRSRSPRLFACRLALFSSFCSRFPWPSHTFFARSEPVTTRFAKALRRRPDLHRLRTCEARRKQKVTALDVDAHNGRLSSGLAADGVRVNHGMRGQRDSSTVFLFPFVCGPCLRAVGKPPACQNMNLQE